MEAKKHTLSLTTFRYTFFSFFFQKKDLLLELRIKIHFRFMGRIYQKALPLSWTPPEYIQLP